MNTPWGVQPNLKLSTGGDGHPSSINYLILDLQAFAVSLYPKSKIVNPKL
jgi:hypothetical protein